MNRLFELVLVVLCAVCVYVSVSCYTKMTEYDAKLVSLNVLLNQQSEVSNSLNEEDLIIMKTIDEQNKKIKAQDDKIRIQDALINEMRVRTKRK